MFSVKNDVTHMSHIDTGLYFHDFLVFVSDNLVNVLDCLVVNLLDIIKEILNVILSQITGLLSLLSLIVKVSSEISYCNLGILAHCLYSLGKFLSSFLGYLRD